MIKVTINPKTRENLYGLMVQKEVSLRKRNLATLHRSVKKKQGEDKWTHITYNGWIRFQKGLGGVVVAIVQAINPDQEWQLLSSLIGFLDRYFRDSIGNINIGYETIED